MNKLLVLIFFINFTNVQSNYIRRFLSTPTQSINTYCVYEYDCGLNGNCKQINSTTSTCVCDPGYITVDNTMTPCNYQQIKQLEAFLVSFFVGCLGVDWFVLARGNSLYIGLGVLKILTWGGCGIWWIVDVVRILFSSFPDGNGQPLYSW